MKHNSGLRDKAIQIFDFFKEKDLGDLSLYFDNDFNDYYIVVKDEICDTQKYNFAVNEYMKTFDISNINVLSEKYLLNKSDLMLIDSFTNFRKHDIQQDYSNTLSVGL